MQLESVSMSHDRGSTCEFLPVRRPELHRALGALEQFGVVLQVVGPVQSDRPLMVVAVWVTERRWKERFVVFLPHILRLSHQAKPELFLAQEAQQRGGLRDGGVIVDPALDLRILWVLVGHAIALDLRFCTFSQPNADEGKKLGFLGNRAASVGMGSSTVTDVWPRGNWIVSWHRSA